MAKDPIPVVIVAGFLGSGKTTLLNHLLRSSGGTRIGVVVNDFGSINIDALAVAGQVDSMVSLSNGCLCCAVDPAGLDAMLDRLATPSAGIDVIVIEASGLAEPRDLIRLMLASENPGIRYGGLIEVIDAVEFDATRARHPELDKHVAVADLVVLNKTDRIPLATREQLCATLDRLSAGVPVVATDHGRIDPALLFDAPAAAEADDAPRQLSFDDLLAQTRCDHEHLHESYQTVEFSTATPLHPRRLLAVLADRPAGLYRAKGHVYFGVPGHVAKFGVQAVGDFLNIDRAPWRTGERRGTQLVLIGSGLDATAVDARLRACEEPAADQLDEQVMLPILRYISP